MKIPYQVRDPDARTIGGARVERGIVRLTEGEAEHWLRMGAIEGVEIVFTPDVHDLTEAETPVAGIDVIDEFTAGLSPRHPLDHDGDGKPGGSLPGRKRRRRKPAQADEA